MIMILFIAAGCKSRKVVSATNPQPGIIIPSNKVNIDDIIKRETGFKTFSTKAKSTIELDGNGNDVTLNIRIKKGEIIWASITAIAGIEIARIYITPDSIKLLNRTNSEFIRKPFSFIHEYVGSQIDFNALEAVLVGNSLPFALKKQSKLPSEGNIVLSGVEDNLEYKITYSEILKVINILLDNPELRQKLEMQYADYTKIADKQIPAFVKITSNIKGKSVLLNMEYSNIVIDAPLDFPFNIPNRYTIID